MNDIPPKKLLRNLPYARQCVQKALDNIFDEGGYEHFVQLLFYVIKAQGGISNMSRHTKINRQHIYRALDPKGNPKFKTILAILKTLDILPTININKAYR